MPEVLHDFKSMAHAAWSNVPECGYEIAAEAPRTLKLAAGISGQACDWFAEVTLNPDGSVTAPGHVKPVIEDGWLTGIRVLSD